MKRKEILKKIDKKYKELEDVKNHMSNNLKAARDGAIVPNFTLIDSPVESSNSDVNIINPEPPKVKAEVTPLTPTYIENCSHTVGYCEGALYQLEMIKYYLTASKKQIKKDHKGKKIKK